jgi:hypothetical protein
MTLAACAPRRLPDGPCFSVAAADSVRFPDHPPAVWLLGERHDRADTGRYMLRFAGEPAVVAPRYWERAADSLHIHVMGGMWGDHFFLRRTAEGWTGRFEQRTDFGPGGTYEVSLHPIGCGSRTWDDAGPRLQANVTSM